MNESYNISAYIRLYFFWMSLQSPAVIVYMIRTRYSAAGPNEALLLVEMVFLYFMKSLEDSRVFNGPLRIK